MKEGSAHAGACAPSCSSRQACQCAYALPLIPLMTVLKSVNASLQAPLLLQTVTQRGSSCHSLCALDQLHKFSYARQQTYAVQHRRCGWGAKVA